MATRKSEPQPPEPTAVPGGIDEDGDGIVDKVEVKMSNARVAGRDGKGNLVYRLTEAKDYVRPQHLDAYVADARTRWDLVEVGTEPDAGPGGYHGQTYVPDTLDVPDAGQTYPATGPAATQEG